MPSSLENPTCGSWLLWCGVRQCLTPAPLGSLMTDDVTPHNRWEVRDALKMTRRSRWVKVCARGAYWALVRDPSIRRLHVGV